MTLNIKWSKTEILEVIETIKTRTIFAKYSLTLTLLQVFKYSSILSHLLVFKYSLTLTLLDFILFQTHPRVLMLLTQRDLNAL